jgi:hypothetical protein
MTDTTPSLPARLLTVVSSIGPPISLATALLLYFGWARTDAQAEAMGIDVSVFSYSAQDYVLRSVNSLFSPLLVILALALAWHASDGWLRGRATGAPETIARVAAGVAAVGVVGMVAGAAVALAAPPLAALAGPFLLAVSVLLSVWSLRLRAFARGTPAPGRAVANTLVFCIVALLLFWGTASFAQALGNRIAADYETTVFTLPRATIVSGSRLGIDAPTVTETVVGPADSPAYRYSGLRLLVLSEGRYFLLNDGWTRADGTIVVVRDGSSLWVQFSN